MSDLGVHYALGPDDAGRLLAAGTNDEVLAVLRGIRDRRENAWTNPCQGAWNPIHRCLSNGTVFYDEGEYPLNRAVLGGRHLYDGDNCVVSLVSREEVKDVAAALAPLTERAFRERYDAIDPDDYDGEHGDPDFRSAWKEFQGVRELYRKAALEGRSMVFVVGL